MKAFGVDIGGSGIKGAPVHLGTGVLAAPRYTVPTPHPAEPEAMVTAVREVVQHFGWTGPVGITFPGVVVAGVTRTAANVSSRWIGVNAAELMADRLGVAVAIQNDADAAGTAEMTYGAGRTWWTQAGCAGSPSTGPTIVLTLGTGIGSAIFAKDALLPNTELGHLNNGAQDWEKRASAKVLEDEGLSWELWARQVDEYLVHVEKLFSPSLFIVGGGVSREADKFLPLLRHVTTPVVAAELHNNAGIVGAAMAADEL
ncbi:polyphosphate--glucose phosphotransferase [Streptomyces sp. NPDC054775]